MLMKPDSRIKYFNEYQVDFTKKRKNWFYFFEMHSPQASVTDLVEQIINKFMRKR